MYKQKFFNKLPFLLLLLGLGCKTDIKGLSTSLNNNVTTNPGASSSNGSGSNSSGQGTSTVVISQAPNAYINTNNASFSFSGINAVLFECKLDSQNYSVCNSPMSLSNLAAGAHTFSIRSKDSSGVYSNANSNNFTYDNVAPTISFSSTPASTSTNVNSSIAFSASDASSGVNTIKCALDSATLAICTSPVVLTNLSVANHVFKVEVADKAGNVTTSTSSFAVTAAALPTVAAADLPPSSASLQISGQAWYVRLDGGTNLQCDGKADAAYPGTGTNQHCAFKNPHYLWGNDVYGETPTWKIAGGDTVIFKGGPFRLGYKGPSTVGSNMWGQCPGDPYGCSMPKIPAGTANQHTKLLGENFGNCTAKTQLFGGYALNTVVNLRGAKYVDVACLEITDHETCSRFGTNDNKPCDTSIGDYATVGIATDVNTANVSLIDLNIHGLVSRGIIGPIGGILNANHVRLAFNGGAGWDFDDGIGTKSLSGSFVNADYLTIEWNGCNEEYPIVSKYPARSCYDQNSAGYGDGLGTPNTVLDFTCNHCDFNHNTQDGFDFLHSGGSQVTVKNSIAYANMGQQWKLGGMTTATFQNNLTVHNCLRMSVPITGAPVGYNAGLSNFCRAANSAIAFNLLPNAVFNYDYNTMIGYADTLFDIGCSTADCSTAKVNYRNNIIYGYPSPITKQNPGIFYNETGVSNSIWNLRSNNIYYHARTCPTGFSNESCVDPKLVLVPASYSSEDVFDSFDLHLQLGSPAINAGISITGIIDDIFATVRPQGGGVDIGGVEYK
jgi:hypothetical protein